MSDLFATPLSKGIFSPNTPVDNSESAYSWLSQFGLMRVQGPDSERLLQGQLTCDVAKLAAANWVHGACCTAKGRMVANFVITRDADGYWLRMPREQVTALMTHLKKYAVFFKAELSDLSDSHKVIGWMPALPAQPTEIDPQQPRVCQWQDNTTELTYIDGRKEFWLDKEAAGQRLNNQPLCSSARWNQFDIQAGTILVTAVSQERWIPQNIDWQQQAGVSFNKGCYTGQETVARLQYLGKSHKSLYWLQATEIIEAELLSSVKSPSGSSLGELASWQDNQGLALLNNKQELPEVIIKTQTGEISVTAQKLSYTEEQELNSDS